MKHRHTGIVCRDIGIMKEYYQELGMKPVYDEKIETRIVKFDSGLELIQYSSDAPESTSALLKQGISHIAFTTDPEENIIELVEVQNAIVY